MKLYIGCFQDGEHQCEDTTPEYTDEQLQLMQSQDLKYIMYKRSTEVKVNNIGGGFIYRYTLTYCHQSLLTPQYRQL